MIDHLKALEEYLKINKMEGTLQTLRAQILGKYPQVPSNQLLSMVEDENAQKISARKALQISSLPQNCNKNKKKDDRIFECLLGKIAYSQNQTPNQQILQKLPQLYSNKIFKKIMMDSQPNNSDDPLPVNSKLHKKSDQHFDNQFYSAKDNMKNIGGFSHEFQDQLDLIEGPISSVEGFQNKNSDQLSSFNRNNNVISKIDFDTSQISIVSQPSFVMEQLNKQDGMKDGYTDDNDLGYYQYTFTEKQLINGCKKLTQKYGYPEQAIKKNSKHRIQTKNPSAKNCEKKFPPGIIFPSSSTSSSSLYPRQYNSIIYDQFNLKVIFDRQKTGFQDFEMVEGDIIAGRYEVVQILGAGVFARVIKALDLLKNKQETCLKIISNNKDFFDQALDQIKILRFINANIDTDLYNLLKLKGVFYYKEHLFIETDLMKDNLYYAYRKNPAFFSIPVIKQIAQQILLALSALHNLRIMHADLKPQNILIKSYNPIKIKVVDLGNSCFFHDHLGQYVQSRSYRSPEVILGIPYDQKIDIWSLGCILAELWTKNVLFYNISIQGMLAKIQSIVGPWPEWMLAEGQLVQNYFSTQNLIFYKEDQLFNILIPKITTLKSRIRTQDAQFLKFLEGLLKIDPNFRLSAEQALSHSWILS